MLLWETEQSSIGKETLDDAQREGERKTSKDRRQGGRDRRVETEDGIMSECSRETEEGGKRRRGGREREETQLQYLRLLQVGESTLVQPSYEGVWAGQRREVESGSDEVEGGQEVRVVRVRV